MEGDTIVLNIVVDDVMFIQKMFRVARELLSVEVLNSIVFRHAPRWILATQMLGFVGIL
jgi:hypothetical protein